MPLEPKDRRALLWGAPVAAVLLLYLLTRGGSAPVPSEPDPNAIQPVMPAAQPATYATPLQPPVAAPVAVAAPGVDVSQLHLFGLLSRGAVIGMADGSQRFVPVGREIVPGVTLRGVDVHHAILATPSGEVRLGFDSAAAPQNAVVAAPVMSGTPPRP